MKITKTSIVTGKTYTKDIPVDPNDMMLYKLEMGSLNDIMPYLTDDDRMFILTGVTKEEWQEAFAKVSI